MRRQTEGEETILERKRPQCEKILHLPWTEEAGSQETWRGGKKKKKSLRQRAPYQGEKTDHSDIGFSSRGVPRKRK